MRLRATLAALLVAIVLSSSYVSSACGAACAAEDFHSGRSDRLDTSPKFEVAEVTTCHHGHPLNGKAIEPNTSAVWVSESAACDDHDCDPAPAVVQSSDILKNGRSSNAALSVVYQATKMGSEVHRIVVQIPPLQNTSPPSVKTILRV